MSQKHCCKQMEFLLQEGKVAFEYIARFREYSMDIRGNDVVSQKMIYCPWCGKKLPDSLRDACALEIESLGYDGIFDESIPDKYQTDEWWRENYAIE